mmetsp:Transcript_81546/g.176247  ORF Transcript_81546/g.176247 Transcript_81546/m.176247 type:complete len:268 (+) Transcript_81546:1797-2600(+)
MTEILVVEVQGRCSVFGKGLGLVDCTQLLNLLVVDIFGSLGVRSELENILFAGRVASVVRRSEIGVTQEVLLKKVLAVGNLQSVALEVHEPVGSLDYLVVGVDSDEVADVGHVVHDAAVDGLLLQRATQLDTLVQVLTVHCSAPGDEFVLGGGEVPLHADCAQLGVVCDDALGFEVAQGGLVGVTLSFPVEDLALRALPAVLVQHASVAARLTLEWSHERVAIGNDARNRSHDRQCDIGRKWSDSVRRSITQVNKRVLEQHLGVQRA